MSRNQASPGIGGGRECLGEDEVCKGKDEEKKTHIACAGEAVIVKK